MSLFDALLLDDYADPRDQWITQRADGILGSSTANDPRDGGVILLPSGSFSAPTFDPNLVLVLTPFDHTFSNGNVAVQAATTGGLLGRAPYFPSPGGTVNITKVSNRAFTYAASSTPEGPPDSSILATFGASQIPGRIFWPVIRVAMANHGFSEYQAISIQGVTLSPSGSTGLNGDNFALGVDDNKSTSFYILAKQWPGTDSLSGGSALKYLFRFDQAIDALPDFTTIGSVLRLGSAPPANPFKTRGLASGYVQNPTAGSPNDYVLMVGTQLKNGQRIVGPGIDAVVLQLGFAIDPYNPVGALGSFKSLPNGIEVSGLSVDSNIAGQINPANRITYSGNPMPSWPAVATQGNYAFRGSNTRLRRVRFTGFGTQSYPEAFVASTGGERTSVAGSNNFIEDCVVEKPGENNTHEVTLLTGLATSGVDVFESVIAAKGQASGVRRCYVNCTLPSGLSTQPLRIVAISSDPFQNPPGINGQFVVTCRWNSSANGDFPRGFGKNIVLSGIQRSGSPSLLQHPFYRGSFPILSVTKDVVSDPQLIKITCWFFDVPPVASWNLVGAPFLNANGVSSLAGIDFHSVNVGQGTGGVAEGNAFYDCLNPVYDDTAGSTRDCVVRNNYLSAVHKLSNQNFSLASANKVRTVTSGGVTRPNAGAEPRRVEVVTSSSHYMSVGDMVQMSGINDSGGGISAVYNGVFYVSAVTSAIKFEYLTYTDPTAAPSASAALYDSLKQNRRFIFENNVVDMFRGSSYTDPGVTGLSSFVNIANISDLLPQFPGWIIRDNIIRTKDGLAMEPGTVSKPRALRMAGLKSAIVELNLSDVDDPFAFQYLNPRQSLTSFQNTNASGTVLLGALEDSGGSKLWMSDAITAIEDAMMLGL